MKIAICTFHNSTHKSVIGGITSGPVYLKESLLSVSPSTDIAIYGIGKPHKYSAYVGTVSYINNDYEKLNDYDFIIFMTPGLTHEKYDESKSGSAYSYILSKLETPFGFIVNEEMDHKLYPYADEFYKHENFKYLMLNSIDMTQDFEDFLVKGDVKSVEFQFLVPLKSLSDILSEFDKKSLKVTSTARLTDRKRVVELVSMAKDLSKYGIQLSVAGAAQNYWASKKVLDQLSDLWTYEGEYVPSDLPNLLKDTRFHYNFTYKKSRKSAPMRDRLELSTLEALNLGCVPIICRDTTPKWLKSTSGVILEAKDLSNLPEELSKISVDEARSRLISFYEDIVDNVPSQYLSILKDLTDIVNNNKDGKN